MRIYLANGAVMLGEAKHLWSSPWQAIQKFPEILRSAQDDIIRWVQW